MIAAASTASAADLGPGAYAAPAVQPLPPPNKWEFSFTPYGWLSGINGNATARGHTVDVDESFIEILRDSNSFAALMGYFEARKGPFSLFTDVVWADLGFPGSYNFKRTPFARFPQLELGVRGRRSSTTRSSSSSRASAMRSPNGPTAAARASPRSMSWAAPAIGTSRPASPSNSPARRRSTSSASV